MRVAIIGGTGFVGSYLTDALLNSGRSVSLLVRQGSESKLRQPEQVLIVNGDIADTESIRRLLQACDAVIYNVGILREVPRKDVTFESTQYEGLVNTVDAALAVGVQRFLLMSANGVKIPGTRYQETKRRAEEYALKSGLDVTVFRPSVIFGDPRGTMEFATQLFNEMVSRIAAAKGRRKWFLPMPIALMRIGATLFDWLSFFPVTRGQLTMLEEGNVADPEIMQALTGREATSFSVEHLDYLGNQEAVCREAD